MSTVFLSPASFQDLVRLETFMHLYEDPLAVELLDFTRRRGLSASTRPIAHPQYLRAVLA
jgi:hypothetical protein